MNFDHVQNQGSFRPSYGSLQWSFEPLKVSWMLHMMSTNSIPDANKPAIFMSKSMSVESNLMGTYES